MKLLFLPHRVPFPPHKGEKIRAFNILRFLAKQHEVHLASLNDDSGMEGWAAELRPYVQSLLVQDLSPRARKVAALAAILGREAVTTRYFHTPHLQRRIDDLIEQVGIDAIFCSSSPMAEYVFKSRHWQRLRAIPKIMDLIDVDSVKWDHYADQSSPWAQWLYRREARCLAALEQRISRGFDHVLVVSEAERRLCAHLLTERVITIPNGVDLEYFSPDAVVSAKPVVPMLVFTGVLNYRPNIDGVIWFADRIFPRIRESVPEAQLCVVGSHPANSVRRLARRPGIQITGFVPDVREYLGMAAVCIAPLRIARGIQNKVLEAMAMGRPVVATAQSFEGIDALPGRDILVATDELQYATMVIDLLRDRERAIRIGRAARTLVEQRYSWTANLQHLTQLFASSTRERCTTHPGWQSTADSSRAAAKPRVL